MQRITLGSEPRRLGKLASSNGGGFASPAVLLFVLLLGLALLVLAGGAGVQSATPANSPTISSALSSSSIVAGGTMYDTSSLKGATATAGGTVTYYYFTDSLCNVGETQVGQPVDVSNGVVPNSNPQAFDQAGNFSWYAYYSGDANNNFAVSPCEPLTVELASPRLSLSFQSSNITIGDSEYAAANMTASSPTAGGTLTYELFSGYTCAGSPTVVNTVSVVDAIVPRSYGYQLPNAGNFSWNAVYSGDTSNHPATSPCEQLTVGRAPVSVTTSLTEDKIDVGSSVAGTASLFGETFNAGGKVTYYYFSQLGCSGTRTQAGKPVNVTDGVVPDSVHVIFDGAGQYSWQAVYTGDSNNSPATGQCAQFTVGPVLPMVSLTVNSTSVTVDQSVVVSATLADFFNESSMGYVVFYYYNGSPCTGSVSVAAASASVSYGRLTPKTSGETLTVPGTYYWEADYSGDTNNLAAKSQCELVTVNVPGVSLSAALSASTVALGASVTDTVTLKGETSSAGGTVSYYYYSGGFCSGKGTAVGTPVTVAHGVVPGSAAQAFSAPGTYSWDAVYSGDPDNNAATSQCQVLAVGTFAHSTVTVSCAPATIQVGQSTKCKATITGFGPPTGSVGWLTNSSGTLSKSSCKLTQVPADYWSTCAVNFIPSSAPFHSVLFTANYTGDSNNLPSIGTNPAPLKVTPKPSTISIRCTPAVFAVSSSEKTTTATCTAKVSGYSPTGTVTWTQSGTGFVSFSTASCTLVKGTCGVTLTGTQAGSVTVSALYGGDTNNKASSSPHSQGKLKIT